MIIYRDSIKHEVEGPAKVYHNREGHTIEFFKTPNGPLFFVTLKDSHLCAHGRTVAEAVADAKWKDPKQRPSMEALVSEIRKAGIKTRPITLPEFRMLTGACLEGCRQALEAAGMKNVTALTAHAIKDKVSEEWGQKLLTILEDEEERYDY